MNHSQCKPREYKKFIKIFGIRKSMVKQLIAATIPENSNLSIRISSKYDEVTVCITAQNVTSTYFEHVFNLITDKISLWFGNSVFALENKSIEEVVAEILIKNNISISVAESCTGGLVSAKLTNISGISQVFYGAVISYSNKSKVQNLGVKQETLDQYGAVSEPTAIEMASGVRERSMTDIGVSITGIAGPTGATPDKPVGLVYMALVHSKKTWCKKFQIEGDREDIRNTAALHAINMVREYSKLVLRLPDLLL